jgi:hypothetical protein
MAWFESNLWTRTKTLTPMRGRIMPRRWYGYGLLLVGAALAGGGTWSTAQQPPPPGTTAEVPPKFLHGHDLKVRPGGEKDFTEKTPRIGVELYHDVARQVVLALSEKGWIAAVPAPSIGSNPQCKWLTAHDLHARKADEKDFTPKTRKYGVEVFQDLALRQLLYICESGAVALAPLPAGLVTDRGPKFLRGFSLGVRRPEQSDFANAPRFGVEIFRDENTPDGLICIVGESGSIATVPSPTTPAAAPSEPVKNPQTLYGLILRVRSAQEKAFSDTTRRFSIEVYADTNTAPGHLLYISQTGAIAAAVQKKVDESKRGVTWLGGMALRARRAGERSFDKATQYNIEVFRDNRSGNLLYICETGSIAVVSQ